MPGWIGGIFQLFLGAFGPSPPTARFSGLVANAVENEPFFMCLAIAVATLGNPGEVRGRRSSEGPLWAHHGPHGGPQRCHNGSEGPWWAPWWASEALGGLRGPPWACAMLSCLPLTIYHPPPPAERTGPCEHVPLRPLLPCVHLPHRPARVSPPLLDGGSRHGLSGFNFLHVCPRRLAAFKRGEGKCGVAHAAPGWPLVGICASPFTKQPGCAGYCAPRIRKAMDISRRKP